jgi:hypothetical protein
MPTADEIRTEHYRQLNAYQQDLAYRVLEGYQELVDYFAGTVGRRWEIDAAIYNEALNILPPLGWRGDSFYMREYLFDDITHKFSREGDRYFCEVAYYPPRPGPRATPAGGREPPI